MDYKKLTILTLFMSTDDLLKYGIGPRIKNEVRDFESDKNIKVQFIETTETYLPDAHELMIALKLRY